MLLSNPVILFPCVSKKVHSSTIFPMFALEPFWFRLRDYPIPIFYTQRWRRLLLNAESGLGQDTIPALRISVPPHLNGHKKTAVNYPTYMASQDVRTKAI